jgi:hypothetical protein
MRGSGVAKYKRKPSAAQRDKTNILIAKILKEKGVISKQAKLHSGRYISKEVLRKVRQYENIARLDYTTVKVNKETAKAAKERGFEVVNGNRIVGPKSTKFRNRLMSGELTGVKPVKGGYMEEVILPHSIFDMRGLIEQLQEGIDTLKLPNEQFAFKYRGNESYRSFMNSQQLLDYLLHYKGIETAINSNRAEDLQEEFDAITIFRLHPNEVGKLIPNQKQRNERSRKRRAEAIREGRLIVKRKSYSDYLEKIGERRANMLREKEAERQRKFREALQADPKRLAEYRAKAVERSRKSKQSRKKP